MQIQTQTSRNVKLVTKRKFNTRTVLNIYGILTVIALILSIFTNPISVNENMQFFHNEEFIMKTYEIKEFLQFIFVSSFFFFFFFLVNIYIRENLEEGILCHFSFCLWI